MDTGVSIGTDLASFLEKLPEIVPGASAKTRDYRPKDARTGDRVRIPVTTITLPKELIDLGSMISFSPTIAVLDDRVLVGRPGDPILGVVRVELRAGAALGHRGDIDRWVGKHLRGHKVRRLVVDLRGLARSEAYVRR